MAKRKSTSRAKWTASERAVVLGILVTTLSVMSVGLIIGAPHPLNYQTQPLTAANRATDWGDVLSSRKPVEAGHWKRIVLRTGRSTVDDAHFMVLADGSILTGARWRDQSALGSKTLLESAIVIEVDPAAGSASRDLLDRLVALCQIPSDAIFEQR
jgi:hypothetical protein